MAKDFIKKQWCIFGKGEVGVMRDYMAGQEFADTSYGYNCIMFTGTKGDLEDTLLEMYKDETYFKVIDFFEYKSYEYYTYLYGPDFKNNEQYKATIKRKAS
jgi:hypothetical protein